RALNILGRVDWDADQPEAAIARFREAYEAAGRTASQIHLVRTLGNLGAVLLDLGRLDDARAYLEEAIAIKGLPHAPTLTHVNLAFLLQEQGHFEEAVEHLEIAGSASLSGRRRGVYLWSLAVLRHERGQTKDPLLGYQDAIRIFHEVGDVECECFASA